MTLKFHIERSGYIFLSFKHATRLADPCNDFSESIRWHTEIMKSFLGS